MVDVNEKTPPVASWWRFVFPISKQRKVRQWIFNMTQKQTNGKPYCYHAARAWRRIGCCVIPIRLDGSKAPAIPKWQEYQQRKPTDQEIDRWFCRPAGIGIVCGKTSGGLEVLDFDDGSLFPAWYDQVAKIARWLPIIETPSDGYHVLYRCVKRCGNMKIAVDPQREKQTLIETRGDGGYILGVGSGDKAHPTGRCYIQHQGADVLDAGIPFVSPDERLQLWRAARSFDRSGEYRRLLEKERRKLEPRRPRSVGDDETPWAQFDRTADFPSLLESAGWTTQDGERWTRPGKASGTSATLRSADDGQLILVVFSSNAGITLDGNNRKLRPSQFVAEVRFGGDWKRFTSWARQEVSA